MLLYFMAIWSILRPFGIDILCPFVTFYGYMEYFSRFGMLYQDTSGNHALNDRFYRLYVDRKVGAIQASEDVSQWVEEITNPGSAKKSLRCVSISLFCTKKHS
jgi:hypothetical protein